MFNSYAFNADFKNRAKAWAVSQSGRIMVDVSSIIFMVASHSEEEFLKKKMEIEYALDRTLLDLRYQFEQEKLEKHHHTLAEICQVFKVLIEEGIVFGEICANLKDKS